jgi:nicotinamidase-related amidase
VTAELALSRERAALLVIDIQERLAAAMPQDVRAQVIRNTAVLIETAKRFALPITVTQQYPKGLGATVRELEDALRDAPKLYRFDKTVFSASQEFFPDPKGGPERDQVIVAGMEAHVCVYQTVRGLVARGLATHVVADAVASRTEQNWQIGLNLSERAGGIVTSTEVVVFDLLGRAGTEEFKTLSKLIK